MVGIALAVVSACADPPPPSPRPTGGPPVPGPTISPTQGPIEPTPVWPSEPASSPPPATSSPPPATSTPPPSASVDIEWLATDPASEFSTFDLITDATSVGGTLVAVGAYQDDAGQSGAATWHSIDGLLWRRALQLPGAMDAQIEDVTVGPAGLVAVGFFAQGEDIGPRTWTSQDGLSWTVSDDTDLRRGQMSAVAANALGYVVLGFDPQTGEGLVWTSRDGRDWSAPMSVPAFEVQPSVNDVVALGQGFLAYGSTAHNERAALWTSIDGRQWRQVEGFPTSPSSSVNAVTASGTRLVAVGASYLERGTVALAWTSTDGLEWQRVLDHDANEPGEMLSATPLGTRFLAVGSIGGERREDLRATVWSSDDGLGWRREPEQPGFSLARMSEVIRAGPGLVALGERADDPAMEVFTPAVWLGVAR